MDEYYRALARLVGLLVALRDRLAQASVSSSRDLAAWLDHVIRRASETLESISARYARLPDPHRIRDQARQETARSAPAEIVHCAQAELRSLIQRAPRALRDPSSDFFAEAVAKVLDEFPTRFVGDSLSADPLGGAAPAASGSGGGPEPEGFGGDAGAGSGSPWDAPIGSSPPAPAPAAFAPPPAPSPAPPPPRSAFPPSNPRSSPSPVAAADPATPGSDYLVWYGTNRRPIDSTAAAKVYSGERDDHVHYGSCRVFVPKSHRIGSLGSSWLRRMVGRLAGRQDDRLTIRHIAETAEAAFWDEVRRKLRSAAADARSALIFIHGYNVSFDDAALRAAQIGFDLSVNGAMAFFSWPSKGRLDGYIADSASIEASEGAIGDFLLAFLEKSGAETVHVIAHSMGNRGVLRAVNRIADRLGGAADARFGQFLLAAADVDAGTFRLLAQAYARVARRTTPYVSGRDRAVEASRRLHDFDRAELIPPVTILPGIDTINVTNVDLTALGHGYVGEARDVLRDMHSLITGDDPPVRRFGVREMHAADGLTYWEIGA